MAVNNLFNSIPVDIPNRSGFDLSHKNLYTGTCGTLYPIMVDPVLPGDKISLGHSVQVQLPPMATDFYGNINFKVECFFVPNRILYGGWQKFISDYEFNDGTKICIPEIFINESVTARGSLADMLGVKGSYPGEGDALNILPFLAYHKIYDDWYRDSRLQRSVYSEVNSNSGPDNRRLFCLPFNYVTSPLILGESLTNFNDGHSIYNLRQRNFAKDYFTNATYEPQRGDAMSVGFTVDSPTQAGTVGEGSFTIASLRAANSLQLFAERNNIAGLVYSDFINAHFGVRPSDAVTNRCIYLGSQVVSVFNKDIYQTAVDESGLSPNPFSTPGAKYANSQAIGQDSLIDNFEVTEHGFIFVIGSLVPERLYSTGTRKYLFDKTLTDYPFPLLSGTGDVAINTTELNSSTADPDVFGYTQRYSHYKFMLDEVHGLITDNSSLESFALQTSFSDLDRPTLGTSFIQIPTTYLNQIKAVSTGVGVNAIDFWASSYFNYKKSSVLPAYSIPTLGDLHNVHTEVIPNGSFRL